MSDPSLKSSAARVAAALAAAGLSLEIRRFPQSTRTAAEAAAAIGCAVAAIAKSLVFRGADSGRALLAVVSGANQADPAKLAAAFGEPAAKADAAFVRAASGFAIGGVAPVGWLTPPACAIDRSLLTLDEIWAAAGTPDGVFGLTPAILLALTGGTAADLAA